MGRQRVADAGIGIAIVVAGLVFLEAEQLPLAPVRDRGQTITAVYEGWHQNPDGTYSLSWGYFNRNAKEELYIPIGPDNRMEPGGPDLGQPTHFLTRRRRGVFAVTVPADFSDKEVIWTLSLRGETNAIPGYLHRDWMLDALGGEAGGNTPPRLKFDLAGSEGRGPGGITTGPLTATVGEPVILSVWASDDGVVRRRTRGGKKEDEPPLVTLTWHKHQGPGDVTFSEEEIEIKESWSEAATTASFTEPGNYIVRVMAVDAYGVGGSQCCWTNGFVKVTVAP